MIGQLLAHLWGDYILQSDWMAQNKTKRAWPAFVHALLYSLCFVWLCWIPSQHVEARLVAINGPDITIGTSATTMTGTVMKVPIDGKYMIRMSGHYTEPAYDIAARFRWLPWLVIFGTHFLIDRYRLARYVVWAKNFLALPGSRINFTVSKALDPRWVAPMRCDMEGGTLPGAKARYYYANWKPWSICQSTGYPSDVPIWLSTWLLIIADNTLHLTINYLALRCL